MNLSRRETAVAGLFNAIAHRYDFLNHTLSLGQDFLWRKKLVQAAGPGPIFADLAAGTMDVSLALLNKTPKARVLALDIARDMLVRGRNKADKTGIMGVQPTLADARRLPLPANSVDAVTIAFGIRNIRPRQAAWSEILRVLRPGGRLCVLEFGTGKKRIWGGVYNTYLRHILPKIGSMVSKDREAYQYLADSIASFPDENSLAEEMLAQGFASVTFRPMTSGVVFLHVGIKKTAGPESSGQDTGHKDHGQAGENGNQAQASQTAGRPTGQKHQKCGHLLRPEKIRQAFKNKGQTQGTEKSGQIELHAGTSSPAAGACPGRK